MIYLRGITATVGGAECERVLTRARARACASGISSWVRMLTRGACACERVFCLLLFRCASVLCALALAHSNRSVAIFHTHACTSRVCTSAVACTSALLLMMMVLVLELVCLHTSLFGLFSFILPLPITSICVDCVVCVCVYVESPMTPAQQRQSGWCEQMCALGVRLSLVSGTSRPLWPRVHTTIFVHISL